MINNIFFFITPIYRLPKELVNIIINFLFWPHQIPTIQRKLYNRCLKNLPTLSICPNFQIILNSATKSYRLCQFRYILHYSTKFPQSFIYVVEYMQMPRIEESENEFILVRKLRFLYKMEYFDLSWS